jgi:HD-GYP domain-containing protein (c-di-GMP phosphodiesterase class II)
VCYLSLLMGLRLGPYLERERPKLSPEVAREIQSLGVAAMMHDIGVTQLPKEVVERYARTLDETDEAWREHVQIGYAMVRGNLDPTAAAAVLHHHQRFDGSGFPTRTTAQGEELAGKGRDIHIFARIIAAANLYDGLMHPASVLGSDDGVHGTFPSVRALKQMLEPPCRGWTDPFVFAALLSVCPPYPPGSLVTLNDRQRVAVESWDPREPCRPVVVEYREGEDTDTAAHRPSIDLRERPELWIAKIDGHDVSADNFPGSLIPERYREGEPLVPGEAEPNTRRDGPSPRAA